MPTSKEYRHRANACLEANDIFARTAMTELAEEFNHAADEAEDPRGGRLPKAS
jgi:hypothetical protein